MTFVDPVELFVLLLAIGGLVVVVLEIAQNDPRAFLEIATDCEKMARPEKPKSAEERSNMLFRFRFVADRAAA